MFDFIMDALLFLCAVGIAGVIGWLIYIICIEVYNSTLRYETCNASVKVKGKEYNDEYTSYINVPMKVGKVTTFNRVPQYHAAEFNVYVQYERTEYCINDEELYDNAKVGSYINVTVNKGYNKKGDLKNVYLS